MCANCKLHWNAWTEPTLQIQFVWKKWRDSIAVHCMCVHNNNGLSKFVFLHFELKFGISLLQNQCVNVWLRSVPMREKNWNSDWTHKFSTKKKLNCFDSHWIPTNQHLRSLSFSLLSFFLLTIRCLTSNWTSKLTQSPAANDLLFSKLFA